jgi:hypothetical protein
MKRPPPLDDAEIMLLVGEGFSVTHWGTRVSEGGIELPAHIALERARKDRADREARERAA